MGISTGKIKLITKFGKGNTQLQAYFTHSWGSRDTTPHRAFYNKHAKKKQTSHKPSKTTFNTSPRGTKGHKKSEAVNLTVSLISVRDEIRTHTGLRPLPPQSSVSTNSTTRTSIFNSPCKSRMSAQNRTRTCTTFQSLEPETSASTNSATWALILRHSHSESERRDSNPRP